MAASAARLEGVRVNGESELRRECGRRKRAIEGNEVPPGALTPRSASEEMGEQERHHRGQAGQVSRGCLFRGTLNHVLSVMDVGLLCEMEIAGLSQPNGFGQANWVSLSVATSLLKERC
jgi:hypothetical protein